MASEWVIGIIVFIIIVVIIVVVIVVIGWMTTRGGTSSADMADKQAGPAGGLLASCREITCAQGYTCDASTMTCRVPIGAPCTSFSECPTGAYCSGVCVTGPHGDINLPCPCNQGLICTNVAGKDICKYPTGATCVQDSDCSNNKCLEGICVSGVPDGSPCGADADCITGSVCSLGYCQTAGITTGTEGAACGICNEGLLCFNNVCITATQGLGSNCTNNTFCQPPLLCLNSTGVPCQNNCSGDTNTCAFVANNQSTPMFCPLNSCVDPYSCSNNMCLGPTAAGCVVNSNCASGSCQENYGAIYILTYTQPVVSCDPLNVIGALNLGWTLVVNLPSGVFPNKIFTVTDDNNMDTLYIVSPSGLYTFQQNQWIQLVPQVTAANQTFIDAAYGPITGMLVAVAEAGFRTLYTLDTSTGVLTPYNQTFRNYPVQYTTSQQGLSIDTISVSPTGDVMIFYDGIPYTKSAGATNYAVVPTTSQGQVTSTPVRGAEAASFYYDIPGTYDFPSYYNIAYVKSLQAGGCDVGTVLTFNGNVQQVYYPKDLYIRPSETTCPATYTVVDYSIYSPFANNRCNNAGGMSNSNIIIIATDSASQGTFPYIINNGVQLLISAYCDQRSRCCVSPNAYYLYAPGTCA